LVEVSQPSCGAIINLNVNKVVLLVYPWVRIWPKCHDIIITQGEEVVLIPHSTGNTNITMYTPGI
jgi:hypothetical protein